MKTPLCDAFFESLDGEYDHSDACENKRKVEQFARELESLLRNHTALRPSEDEVHRACGKAYEDWHATQAPPVRYSEMMAFYAGYKSALQAT